MEATSNEPQLLAMLRSRFRVHSYGYDPLLEHLGRLVDAAATGGEPPAISGYEKGVVREERRLLLMPEEEAYSELVLRSPELAAMEAKLSDPAWQAAARADPSFDVDMAAFREGMPEALKVPLAGRLISPLVRWRLRDGKARPRKKAYERYVRSMRDPATMRLLRSVGQELHQVQMQLRNGDDSLLRTETVLRIVWKVATQRAGPPSPFSG